RGAGWSDDWSSGCAYLPRDVLVQLAEIGGRIHRNNSRVGTNEAGCPQRIRGVSVRVKGVDHVVFGGYIDNVVRALSGDCHVWHIERLSVGVALEAEGKKLAECCSTHVCRRECHFIKVGTCAGIVVPARNHRYL